MPHAVGAPAPTQIKKIGFFTTPLLARGPTNIGKTFRRDGQQSKAAEIAQLVTKVSTKNGTRPVCAACGWHTVASRAMESSFCKEQAKEVLRRTLVARLDSRTIRVPCSRLFPLEIQAAKLGKSLVQTPIPKGNQGIHRVVLTDTHATDRRGGFCRHRFV